MSRKLLLLNLALATLLGAAGWTLRQRWETARQREQNFLARTAPAVPAAAAPKMDPVAPVTATSYAEVAMNMLFSKDRNPNVVIEAKPEEPVPPFPAAFGSMALGEPTVFMVEKAGAPQKGYRAGDAVGPFVLKAINGGEVVLAWKDKMFVKSLAELKPKEAEAPPAAAPKPAAEAQPAAAQAKPEVASDEKLKQAQKTDGNPWINTGGANHACAPGDNAPAGTVQGGYRKVVRPSMFGSTCFWEPAR